MNNKTIYEDASDVQAEDGIVSVDGPDAVDVKLTPDAAAETSHRLFQAALRAQGQKIRDGKKESRPSD